MSELIYPNGDETCPLNKKECTHGLCSCVYFKNRFGCYPCLQRAKVYRELTLKQELEQRKKINKEWDYKKEIDIYRSDDNE